MSRNDSPKDKATGLNRGFSSRRSMFGRWTARALTMDGRYAGGSP
jgi:hypothetical protein